MRKTYLPFPHLMATSLLPRRCKINLTLINTLLLFILNLFLFNYYLFLEIFYIFFLANLFKSHFKGKLGINTMPSSFSLLFFRLLFIVVFSTLAMQKELPQAGDIITDLCLFPRGYHQGISYRRRRVMRALEYSKKWIRAKFLSQPPVINRIDPSMFFIDMYFILILSTFTGQIAHVLEPFL